MDRRRFVPDTEGLERREVQTTTTGIFGGGVITNPLQSLPETVQQRLERVKNLPYFLSTFENGRTIPAEPMKAIQVNLDLLITHLNTTPTKALSNYNLLVRKIESHTSLSASDAQGLNNAFGGVLKASNADPTVRANLQTNMNALAKTDAASVNPVFLAINDYSTVLQTALGIGRPLRAPTVPALAKADQLGKSANTSKTATPTLYGTYETNSTMELVNSQGQVIAGTNTLANGQYSMKVNNPLPNGTYKLYVRAVDSGFVSLPSRVFTLIIRAPITSAAVPKGPRG